MSQMATSPQFQVLTGGREYTASDFSSAGHNLDVGGASLVGVHVPDGLLTAAAVVWIWQSRVDAVFLHAEFQTLEAETLARRLGCAYLLVPSTEHEHRLRLIPCHATEEQRQTGLGRVGLLTSGTTGEPKCIFRSRDSLASSVAVRPDLRSARWISLYPLTRFAGFNTLLHAFFNDATIIVPSALQPRAIIEEIHRTGPTHASGTPTLWRNLLMSLPEAPGALQSLRQITLGGEVVDQHILTALRSALPHARVTHIYASTELGVCVAVSDGQAGFPADWLDNASKTTQLRVLADELWIKPRNPAEAVAAGPGGWVATGDVVEIRGGRVFITGRRGEVLNVGGAKVLPSQVEEKIGEVPGIIGARVSGRRSSMSGTLVVAEVVGAAGEDQAAVRMALFRHCRETLPAYAVPRIVTFVDHLPTTRSGKILRERNESL